MLFESAIQVPMNDRYTAHQMVDARTKHVERCRWGFSSDGVASMRTTTEIDGWQPIHIPESGTTIRFAIDAHLRRWSGGRTVKKRRVSNIDYMANMDWIERHAEQFGLEFLNVDVDPIKVFISRPPRPFVMAASRFQGTAKVVNQTTLEQVLTYGIGNAKAFGFGFLLYTPWEV